MLAVKAPHQIKATIRYVVKGERAIFYASERDKSYWPGDDHEVADHRSALVGAAAQHRTQWFYDAAPRYAP